MDINALAQALLSAIRQSNTSQLQTLDQGRRLYNTQINNAANASGLMYSTKPAFQQAQYAASTYLPSYNKINSSSAASEISTQSTIKDALDKIKAINDAAAELNAA